MDAINEASLMDDCQTLALLAEDFADETIPEDDRAAKLDAMKALIARLNAELN